MTKDLCSADFQREQHISFLPMGMLTIQTHGRIIHYQKDGIDLTENIEISQFLGPTNFYYRLNTLFGCFNYSQGIYEKFLNKTKQ